MHIRSTLRSVVMCTGKVYIGLLYRTPSVVALMQNYLYIFTLL